ncbi:GntR family transcriptional regulator [Rarobacter faecitabidus]|uniref:GntR family transcriptional regulator n=1 Tax=Rarobacter faecitabidus TaxID=13243 RepID=A0A542ZUW8_RARFA|nr:GntR family transcriptional regulator [Rarobacter faecitabidus]TQL64147.1 GntR family transcriptional regulator [Rarobacter faecitabidus]
MEITIDPASPVVPFEQIRGQIARQIAAGTLSAGARLGTVRQVAEQLGVAVNTVARAYRELEQAHLIETRGRNGTFVTSASTVVDDTARRAAADYVRLMRDLGISPADAEALVREEYRR